MSEGIHQYFEEIVSRNEGILAVLVTDRDGVPLVKDIVANKERGHYIQPSWSITDKLVADPRVPPNALRASFLSTFSTAAEQASKLGLSRNKSIVCFFASYQVVHFSYLPLVVSVIATSESNTGVLLGLEPDLSAIVKSLQVAVDGV